MEAAAHNVFEPRTLPREISMLQAVSSTSRLAAAVVACALVGNSADVPASYAGSPAAHAKSWRLVGEASTAGEFPRTWRVVNHPAFVPKTALAKKLHALRQKVRAGGGLLPAHEILTRLERMRSE